MARLVQLQPAALSTANTVTVSSSAGGPVRCSYAARSGIAWHLTGVNVYLAGPSSNTLTVYDGTSSGTAVFATGINSTAASFQWNYPLRNTAGNALTVVISSASTGWVYLNSNAYGEN